MLKKSVATLLVFLFLFFNNIAGFALESKYPDYALEFLGADKWENFNRKIFNFNLKLNKYAIRPIHILWSSIVPKYGQDRINGITNNIEYPIRLVSSLIQKDFKTSKNESIRFITNTILGLGGMFDPAKHIFNLEQSKEDMEQALEKCKIKPGPYFVLPVLSFINVRGLFGKALDMALNPSSYVGSPLLAAVKAGMTINRTSYLQPLIKMVESNYADPYDIARKAFGIDRYIKFSNMDRVEVKSKLKVDSIDMEPEKEELVQNTKNTTKNIVKTPYQTEENLVKTEVSSQIVTPKDLLYGGTNIDTTLPKNYSAEDFKLDADIKLSNYNPQGAVIDSMRTSLFTLPGVDESVWNELSIWNRSFNKRIHNSAINIIEGRDNYKFRYIMQKNKKESPLVIIFPSIGEGIMSSHSVLFAKLFYDAGFSAVILGSHFQWEFVKSMPPEYRPGLPAMDALVLRDVCAKIISKLENKYSCKFGQKVILGTSFGALMSLFVASKEYQNNTLGDTKYISVCPPVDLIYAMKQVDRNSQEWNSSSQDLKQKVAHTASKVVKLYQSKKEINFEINNLPFNDEEAKMITGFIMHQKLSDLIYTLENGTKSLNAEIYGKINNMGYVDYAKKYLMSKEDSSCDDLAFESSLNSISEYLQNGNNYKIYHSLNDYLTTTNQIKQLKQITGSKMVLLDNGAHLGFLYRKEFIEDLKNTISGLCHENDKKEVLSLK